MAKIESSTFRNWNNGETMFEADYEQEREIIRVAVNDNHDRIETHKTDTSNPHGTTASQVGAYTKGESDGLFARKDNTYTKGETYSKDELTPFLQGGDTSIKYEVFTIVSSNNGDGTFTYKDKNNVQTINGLTAEGYQVFTLKEGQYPLARNSIECIVGDTLHRSVVSGGLQEMTATQVALTVPEGAGAEITFKYYERVGITGEANLILGEVVPPVSNLNTVWLKVVG